MERFDKVWMRDGTRGTRVGTQVKWKQFPLLPSAIEHISLKSNILFLVKNGF